MTGADSETGFHAILLLPDREFKFIFGFKNIILMNRTVTVTLTSIRSSIMYVPAASGRYPDQKIMNRFLVSIMNRFDEYLVRMPGMKVIFASWHR